MEDKDLRSGWLRDLKVGDKVFIITRYSKYIKTVTKITPTGKIKIGESTYNSGGRFATSDVWNTDFLSEWTQEKEDEFKKELHFTKMCKSLSDLKWNSRDYDLVQKIYEMVMST